MRKRKDLQVLRGKQADVVLAGGGSIIDPVSELERWLEVRRRVLAEHGVELPLFCWPSGRVVTTSDIRGAVRRVMAAAGRDPPARLPRSEGWQIRCEGVRGATERRPPCAHARKEREEIVQIV